MRMEQRKCTGAWAVWSCESARRSHSPGGLNCALFRIILVSCDLFGCSRPPRAKPFSPVATFCPSYPTVAAAKWLWFVLAINQYARCLRRIVRAISIESIVGNQLEKRPFHGKSSQSVPTICAVEYLQELAPLPHYSYSCGDYVQRCIRGFNICRNRRLRSRFP